jgi:hypothetical protein
MSYNYFELILRPHIMNIKSAIVLVQHIVIKIEVFLHRALSLLLCVSPLLVLNIAEFRLEFLNFSHSLLSLRL